MIEQAVLQVTKNQLEEALPQWLLGEIKDRDTGLNMASSLDIFNHALDCRDQIEDDPVNEYISKYNSRIDMSQGFNQYVECQEEYCDFFKDAEQPITDAELEAKRQLH
eukprot:2108685-Ditylum_brightwellii.AAC.1